MKNNDFSYDELYGIDLDEYLLKHRKTIDELINEISIDISILENNLRNKINCNDDCYLINSIVSLLEKKRKHLDKIKKWKITNKRRNNA